mgnify:CR=1 FL=1
MKKLLTCFGVLGCLVMVFRVVANDAYARECTKDEVPVHKGNVVLCRAISPPPKECKPGETKVWKGYGKKFDCVAPAPKE